MNEEFIINMLTIYAFNFKKYGDEQDRQLFANWMHKLQRIKEFKSIEAACDYYLAQGEMENG